MREEDIAHLDSFIMPDAPFKKGDKMQEVYEDGSVGEIKTADTLEDLLPMIKKSLAHPRVKYVKVFKNGEKVQAEQERTTNKEVMEEIIKSEPEQDVEKMKAVTRTFPSKRR